MARAATKTRVSKKQVLVHRTKATKDHSPTWEGCESWDTEQYRRHWFRAMDYYRLEADPKSYKPAIMKWMAMNGYDKDVIEQVRKLKEWRCNSTMGGIASSLMRGMPAQRPDFNEGKNSAVWLANAISEAVEKGKADFVEEKAEEKASTPTISIQDRIREASYRMTEEVEDALEDWITDPEAFDNSKYKVLNMLKSKEVKAVHARIIRDHYQRNLDELEELASGNADEQLREGYSRYSKKNVKKLIQFHRELHDACTMLMQEAKVNRKPRAKKAPSKEKLIAKLKYKKTDDALKLVSINPMDIVGASELWIYNTKSRKLGKYVANNVDPKGLSRDGTGLSIKGTTIIGYDENASICKTIRKPEEKLKEFKAAGKVALRKFMDDINAVDTKMNGRINEEIVLLRVQ